MLFLDDDARFDFYEADVVLNQNIDAKAERYKCGATTHLLLGADYVLLRPEFLEERPRKDVAGGGAQASHHYGRKRLRECDVDCGASAIADGE